MVVLEERDRIGGRIRTDRSLGAAVDLGASWIQGTAGNPITRICRTAGIAVRKTDDDSVAVYRKDGSRVEDVALEDCYSRMGRLETYLEHRAGFTTDRESVGDGVEKRPEGDSPSSVDRWYLQALIEHEYAAPMSELSLRHTFQGSAFAGTDVVFPGGYDQVPGFLAQGRDIRLGQVVRGISYGPGGVRIETETEVYEAEAGVVTVPLGVLKAGVIRFDPALPEAKTAVVARLGMGRLEKVALAFREAFWEKDLDFLGFTDTSYGIAVNLLSAVDVPILVFFFLGEAGSTGHGDIEEVMGLLRRAYGKAVPEPEGVVLSGRLGDAFAGGSYSFVPVGGDAADFDALAAPAGKVLYFGGEATNRDYNATVHGAYLSGVRAARDLLRG